MTTGTDIPQKRPPSVSEVLACPMPMDVLGESGARTVGEYLVILAEEVWVQGENFSGKRPFGFSSWQVDVEAALVRAGLVDGEFDEDDCLERADYRAADALIRGALRELRRRMRTEVPTPDPIRTEGVRDRNQPSKTTARCPYCGLEFAVNSTGRLRTHGPPRNRCRGSAWQTGSLQSGKGF
jgi:hypothetical protein